MEQQKDTANIPQRIANQWEKLPESERLSFLTRCRDSEIAGENSQLPDLILTNAELSELSEKPFCEIPTNLQMLIWGMIDVKLGRLSPSN